MKNKIKLISIIILAIILLPIFIYLLVDWKNLYVDMYNFRQLEKVKIILKDIKRNDDQFLYLEDFNEIYNQKIEPIKNCYYLRNYKSEDRVPYIFWFKLESLFYSYIYKAKYYAYPKYDLPYEYILPSKNDINFYIFNKIISNPCRE